MSEIEFILIKLLICLIAICTAFLVSFFMVTFWYFHGKRYYLHLKHNLFRNKKQHRDFLEQAMQYYAKYLNIGPVYVYLCVDFDFWDYSRAGWVRPANHPAREAYDIYISDEGSTEQMLNWLAHEMIHIHQFNRKDLVQKVVDGRLRNFWKGKDMTDIPYHDRPWEKEAFGKSQKLANKFTVWYNDKIKEYREQKVTETCQAAVAAERQKNQN